MTTPATQLTITIPEGAPPGSILQIPIKGGAETVKARVPEGLGAGSTLVLTKLEGSDEWVEEFDARPPSSRQSSPVQEQPQEMAQPPASFELAQTGPPSAPVAGPVAYTVRLDTSVGVIDIIVRPDWAPHGARRFLDLAAYGDLDDLAFYRSVKGCLAQFGLPAKRPWPPLPDDPPTGVPFLLGAVCFAAVGQNSRKSTLFICIGDMSHNFGQQSWETPIGAVAENSLDVLDRIETIYGDIAECNGAGPNTGRINAEGNAYLRQDFPLLTYIRSVYPLDWQPPAEEAEQTAQAARAAEAAQAAQLVSEPPSQAAQYTQSVDAERATASGAPWSSPAPSGMAPSTLPRPWGGPASGPWQGPDMSGGNRMRHHGDLPRGMVDVPVEVMPPGSRHPASFRGGGEMTPLVNNRWSAEMPQNQVPAVGSGAMPGRSTGPMQPVPSWNCQPPPAASYENGAMLPPPGYCRSYDAIGPRAYPSQEPGVRLGPGPTSSPPAFLPPRYGGPAPPNEFGGPLPPYGGMPQGPPPGSMQHGVPQGLPPGSMQQGMMPGAIHGSMQQGMPQGSLPDFIQNSMTAGPPAGMPPGSAQQPFFPSGPANYAGSYVPAPPGQLMSPPGAQLPQQHGPPYGVQQGPPPGMASMPSQIGGPPSPMRPQGMPPQPNPYMPPAGPPPGAVGSYTPMPGYQLPGGMPSMGPADLVDVARQQATALAPSSTSFAYEGPPGFPGLAPPWQGPQSFQPPHGGQPPPLGSPRSPVSMGVGGPPFGGPPPTGPWPSF